MNKNNKISVLLPVRNGKKHIAQAIESILLQTYEDFEIIVVNDGSTDGTLDVINSFSDSRIRIVSTKGVGLVSALNLGLKYCNGEYIARMDGDDISMKRRFEIQVEILNNNIGVGIVCSDVEVIDENDIVIGVERDVIRSNNDLRKGLSLQSKMKPIIHPSVMIRRNLLELVSGYREYNSCEDKDLWLRLIEHSTFYRIPQILLKYRITQTGISRTKIIQQKSNAMLTILNYEFKNKFNIDLYLEEPNILKHFYKTFFNYNSIGNKDFAYFQKFKKSLVGKGKFIRYFILMSILFNYRLLKHILFRRIQDRKMIDDSLKLVEKLYSFQKINNLTE